MSNSLTKSTNFADSSVCGTRRANSTTRKRPASRIRKILPSVRPLSYHMTEARCSIFKSSSTLRMASSILSAGQYFKQYSSQVNYRKANDPYFLASFTMMVMISQSQERCGIDEPLDFIFDRQQELESPVQEAWDELAHMSLDGVPRRLGERPQFSDDKVSMPLQAADLHAWWVRRAYEEMIENKERTPFMWSPTRDMECIHIVLDENNIAEFFGSIAMAAKSYWTFSWGRFRFIQHAHLKFAVKQRYLVRF
jgi:hypothetical protein